MTIAEDLFLEGTSAEAWLAAVSAGRKPSAEVREPRASYALGTCCPGGP